ncbi:hypothetical protein BS47DRAFT_1357140 [Hydnum rufescens UP504]|uniref:Uncharacterized protein n=1 Tax=Hydnum rufescens UP504 TaxID=1448309 RepID=A0A9P6E2B0_9AGAM|nr:hypothetical protein BS47DRAFT_1357140 [Hydnum rufescens UP504]
MCETRGPVYDFSQWVNQVDIDRPTLTGDSFGASTTILTQEIRSFTQFPILCKSTSKFVYAPDNRWLDPVPSTIVKLSPKPQLSLAIINSGVATLMKHHFRRFRDTTVDWNEDEKSIPATLMIIGVLMVGLDAARKTAILYKLKFIKVVTMIPTNGFNAETVEYKNISFSVWGVACQRKIHRCGDIDTAERDLKARAMKDLETMYAAHDAYNVLANFHHPPIY